jgi:hypothetical protein
MTLALSENFKKKGTIGELSHGCSFYAQRLIQHGAQQLQTSSVNMLPLKRKANGAAFCELG